MNRISDRTRTLLADEAEVICRRYGLQRLYFAQPLGPRRHFLAGRGEPVLGKLYHLTLSQHLYVFWNGEIPAKQGDDMKRALGPLVRRVEMDMATEGYVST